MNVDRVAQPLRQGEEAATGGEDRIDRLARHAMIDDVENPTLSQARPISATIQSIAAAPRSRPARLIDGIEEKSLISAASVRFVRYSPPASRDSQAARALFRHGLRAGAMAPLSVDYRNIVIRRDVT